MGTRVSGSLLISKPLSVVVPTLDVAGFDHCDSVVSLPRFPDRPTASALILLCRSYYSMPTAPLQSSALRLGSRPASTCRLSTSGTTQDRRNGLTRRRFQTAGVDDASASEYVRQGRQRPASGHDPIRPEWANQPITKLDSNRLPGHAVPCLGSCGVEEAARNW